MIHLMSQRDADQQRMPESADTMAPGGSEVQSISPYLNPAHVLAPPRRWLEAVASGTWVWEFFRLRYKNLLRSRFQAEPERFHALLEASDGGKALTLTCHCLGDRCHRELAREFLERLRLQRLQRAQPASRTHRAPRTPARLQSPRERTHTPSRNLVLATLIEPPALARATQG